MTDYAKSLTDPRWQKKRLRILERDEWTCRDTGATDEELQVHHCWYSKGGPWETPDEYLLTLTRTAHKERQALESRAKKALGLIMAGMDRDDLGGLVESLELAGESAQDRSEHTIVMAVNYSLLHDWLAASEIPAESAADALFNAGVREMRKIWEEPE